MIDGKLHKTIVNEHVWVTPEGGGDGKDFIDRSKLRLSASLLFGMIRIGFNEDDFVGGMDKSKVGMVRGTGRQWYGIKMPFGMKPPKMYSDVYGYDTMIFIVARTDLPFNPGYLLTDFKTVFGYDLHHPRGYGMRWYSSINPEGFIADGVMSPMEAEFDDRVDNWRCVVGPNGWMVHRGLWDQEYFEQAEIKLYYIDDVEEHYPPDYYRGSLCYYYVESTIKSLKPRKYNLQMDWYWPYDFYHPKGLRKDIVDQIVNIRDNALEIKVGLHRVTNRGATATLVEP